MNRPIGVTISAGLQFFYYGLLPSLSCALLAIPPWRRPAIDLIVEVKKLNPSITERAIDAQQIEAMIQEASPTRIMVAVVVTIIICVFFAALYGVLSYYLLKLRKWSWIITLILQALYALSAVAQLIQICTLQWIPIYMICLQISQLIVTILILYYLSRPEVGQAFKRPKKSN